MSTFTLFATTYRDIFLPTIQYLSLKDLIRLSQTCRDFHKFIEDKFENIFKINKETFMNLTKDLRYKDIIKEIDEIVPSRLSKQEFVEKLVQAGEKNRERRLKLEKFQLQLQLLPSSSTYSIEVSRWYGRWRRDVYIVTSDSSKIAPSPLCDVLLFKKLFKFNQKLSLLLTDNGLLALDENLIDCLTAISYDYDRLAFLLNNGCEELYIEKSKPKAIEETKESILIKRLPDYEEALSILTKKLKKS